MFPTTKIVTIPEYTTKEILLHRTNLKNERKKHRTYVDRHVPVNDDVI